MMKKTVAVVIPVYRPGRMLGELICRLSRQTHVPEHVVIINTLEAGISPGEVRDEYLEGLRGRFGSFFGKFTLLHIRKEEFGHGRTRDMGMEMVQTDLCLFMTQDALPRDRSLVEGLEKAFCDPLVAAAYARQLAGKNSSPLEREARFFNYPPVSSVRSGKDLQTLGIRTFFCSDVCAMWRKDVYLQLGGFEKDVIFNEDMILAAKVIKAGYRIAYCADAAVYHHHNYSAVKQLKRNFDLGVSQADHPEVFSMVSSGKEGIRFVKTASRDLVLEGHGALLPQFLWQSGCKYIGYQLGKRYRKLPPGLVRKISDSPDYWESGIRGRGYLSSTNSTQ